jgi:hypothetical protein
MVAKDDYGEINNIPEGVREANSNVEAEVPRLT